MIIIIIMISNVDHESSQILQLFNTILSAFYWQVCKNQVFKQHMQTTHNVTSLNSPTIPSITLKELSLVMSYANTPPCKIKLTLNNNLEYTYLRFPIVYLCYFSIHFLTSSIPTNATMHKEYA